MSKKQIIFITRGLPASGKTTWAKKYVREHSNFRRINRDDLRFMMNDGVWNNKREDAILIARSAIIKELISHGYNLILDDTNIIPFRMEETKQIIKSAKLPKDTKIEIKIKDFTNVPLEESIKRNARRPEKTRVSESFIRYLYTKFIKK